MNTDYPSLCFEELAIHPNAQEASIDGASAGLTRTEFSLLHLLVRHVGRTFTRREIIDAVRGENYPATDRTVDVHVNGLRKKLREYGDWIETVRGTGYKFQPGLSAGQPAVAPSLNTFQEPKIKESSNIF